MLYRNLAVSTALRRPALPSGLVVALCCYLWGPPAFAAQAPFPGTPPTLPGTVQAEDYDTGGEGIAFHDTTAGNSGGQHRSDAVDIETTADASGGFDVGWIDAGEWLAYTVNVPAAFTAAINARVASLSTGGSLHVEIDGQNVTGAMSFAATGGWQTWTTVARTGVALSAGVHVVRLAMDSGAFNVNWVQFSDVTNGRRPFGGTNSVIANGSVLQAENFDLGNEGIAYHDTTAGNTGGQYRTSDVDIETCGDAGGGFNVGWIVDGEWLQYIVDTEAGTYDITARVASGGTAVGDLRVLLDGAVLGTIDVGPTGGWQTYVDLSLRGITITGGTGRTLRLEMVNGGDFNVNFLRFTKTSGGRPPGDVVGKISVGYQGWFAATPDDSPMNAWWHWSQDWSQPPSIAQNTIHAWPDTREYTQLYATQYPNLGNGQPARLFSSFDQSTLDLHFSWMSQYGIDTAALQRFNPNGTEGPIRDAITAKVRTAAEAHGVKFYVMYDVSGWTNMQSEIKNDWLTKMSAHTASSAYARQDGKPVVAIWGFGFNDDNHPWTAATCLDVVNWFKGQGVYVIGGVPTHWRDGVSDSRPGFQDVYHAFNMISPWMVGRIGNAGDVDNFFNTVQQQDLADLNARGIAYQPCVLPGDTGQRAHGDFMWRQFYDLVRLGAHGIYISMFDEYNEGNQIAKTAEDASMSPAGTSSTLFTLNQDGTSCSSDYYLRLTQDGGRMLKGQIPLTTVRPTSPR
jgi:Carbohydrate binding module (family 6)